MGFVGLFLCLSAGGIVYRLYDLQSTEHQKWLRMAARQHFSSFEIEGARGTVLDAAGRILAVSVESRSVAAHPRKIKDKLRVASILEGLTGKERKEISERLSANRPFVWLARGLPLQVEEKLDSLALDGVMSFQEFRRYYPQGKLASPLLGRISRDGKGQSGIELQYESLLAAQDSSVPVRRDARGRFVTIAANPLAYGFKGSFLRASLPGQGFGDMLRGGAQERPSGYGRFRKEGGALQLSIDAVVQNIVEEEFEKGAEASEARQVFGLVMDAQSGEVLAMAQSQRFDPNRIQNVDPALLRNAVLQDSFEPGSVMKPLVAASAFNHDLVREGELFDCENGSFRVGRHVIRDVHPVEIVPFEQVVVRSSNIGMAKLGQRLGKERLFEALRDFGFGETSGLDLPGEGKGILRHHSRWREIDVATHAFGQGVAVTAVQLVRAYAAIANGGILVSPRLLKSGDSSRQRILKPAAAARAASALRQVVENAHGTGKNAAIPGVIVYGKTGTAQKAKRDGRGYDSDNVLSSFVGFVEGKSIGVERTLVMAVIVDEPRVKPRWGGLVAAPVFQRAMKRILSYLLVSESEDVQTASLSIDSPREEV